MFASVLLTCVMAAAPAPQNSAARLWWFFPVEYPRIAQLARVEGTVIADVVLDKDGKVADTKIVSGPPMLREAVLENAKKLRFSRPDLGSTKGMKLQLTYDFIVDKDCDESNGCFENSTIYRDRRWTVKIAVPQINN